MTEVAELVNRAEGLLRGIAPELALVPLYVLLQEDLPPSRQVDGIICGHVTSTLDMELREEIGDRWRGRGVCMVLSEAAIRRWHPAAEFAHTFLAYAVHELAHALADRYADTLHEAPVIEEATAATRKALVVEVAERPRAFMDWVFLSHDDVFIRTALHLRRRAGVFGLKFRPEQIVGGQTHPVASLMYEKFLGDEPERLDGLPMQALLRTPAPADFVDYWDGHVTYFLKNREQPCSSGTH